jgi:hypothetical protein
MEVVMRGFDLDVCVHGRKVRTYKHEGERFIEGRSGSEYTLKIHNNTSRRAVAVISVDGLSVMDGKEASRKGAGYVLDAHSVTEIPGWRLDNSGVARFRFGSVPSSFAGKQKKARNVGVIGCVLYFEVERTMRFMDSGVRSRSILRGAGGQSLDSGTYEYSGGIQTSSLNSRRVKKTTANLGTQFGRRDEHQVREVKFEAEDNQADELVVHYDDREGLEARGIRIGPVKAEVAKPFPKDEMGCKPPPGWRG